MKAQIVEDHIAKDVQSKIGKNLYKNRFIPYLMMHEFEALLFSDCNNFCNGIGKPELTEKFQNIRNQFENPEEIDDTPIQAPSKRTQTLVEGYEKPLLVTLAVLNIGLGQIRTQCPNFYKWMDNVVFREDESPRTNLSDSDNRINFPFGNQKITPYKKEFARVS